MTLPSLSVDARSTAALVALLAVLAASLSQPAAAVDAGAGASAVLDGPPLQQTTAANGTAANGTATDSGGGGGGIVGTVFGAIGGFFGGIISFFADNIIGQAIIGLTLGIYIGLKGLAIYIERYE